MTAVAMAVHRDTLGSPVEHQRIALALVVSLLLHTPLLLSSGVWRTGAQSETSARSLQVRIERRGAERAQDYAARQHTVSEIEEAASPAPQPGDVPEPSELPAETLELVADSGPQLETSDPSAASESTEPLESAVTAAVVNDVADEPAAPGPEAANDPMSTDVLVATVAPAQEAVLTRRLRREARDLLDSSALRRRLTFEDDDRTFTTVLTRQPATDAMGIEHVTVEITTEHGGERVRTGLQMKRLAFSHFTQLVDRWDPEVQLHDDEIAGRFHSNSEIQLTYDREVAPRLLGMVTTARGIRIADEQGWRPRREIFAGGLETRSTRVSLPEVSLSFLREHAPPNADLHVVLADTLIIFYADGAYSCIDLESRSEERRRLVPDRPTYIIAAHNTDLRVRGIVNGSVTVYSPKRILIQGDLTYVHGPHTGADAGAYLGLISNGSIVVDRPKVTGPGDLEIHAALYARKRFVVRNVHARNGGTLFIFGSLTAGSLSATEPRYATRTEFDRRFEHVRPPGFPQTDRYEIETWDRWWRVADAAVRE